MGARKPDAEPAREDVVVPGSRDVRATLDRVRPGKRSTAVVVACPPHPRHGGSRSDSRLEALGRALVTLEVECLRFDYGPWADGVGERVDALSALAWATRHYERVGLFGYSFGGAVALVAAGAERDEITTGNQPHRLDAVSVLAPAAGLPDGRDAAAAIPAIDAPGQVVVGTRDRTVDWETVVDAARAAGWPCEEVDADHLFRGCPTRVARTCATFLGETLR